MIFHFIKPHLMKKIVYIILVLFSFSLAACTRESSKTTENKTTPQGTDKKQEQTSINSNPTDKKTLQTGQHSTLEAAGNPNDSLPVFVRKGTVKYYNGYNEKDNSTSI